MTTKGFIDIQINGYKGVDFSSPQLTEEDVLKTRNELAQAGTAAFCPTLVTNSMDIYERNIPILLKAMSREDTGALIMGIHLEGPFISPLEGARGAHPPDRIASPSIDTFDRLMDLADGHISILTLAPEVDGAMELIRHASQKVVVSLGHHMADDESMKEAVENGATLCTHLGNGMVEMISRHNNPLWWQLSCDGLWASFITDGQHLPEDFIKVALRSKTLDRFIVTCDCVSIAGLPPGDYEFQNAKITLAESGRISLAGTPYLAGSSANTLQCINHLASVTQMTEDELWQVGVHNPLRLLGLDSGILDKYRGPCVNFEKGVFRVS